MRQNSVNCFISFATKSYGSVFCQLFVPVVGDSIVYTNATYTNFFAYISSLNLAVRKSLKALIFYFNFIYFFFYFDLSSTALCEIAMVRPVQALILSYLFLFPTRLPVASAVPCRIVFKCQKIVNCDHTILGFVDGYASLFNCTTAVRASDSMTASS